MARPALFVGSSSEGKRIAEAVQVCLDPVCEVELWTQGVFGLTQGTLESLILASMQFDFALLVLTADDLTISRDSKKSTARDNVLFELGLFIGALGRERTFMLYDRMDPPSLPSDLAGISAATFAPHASGNLVAAVGAPCTKIQSVIERLGLRKSRDVSDPQSAVLIAEPRDLINQPQSVILQDDENGQSRSKQTKYAEITARVSSQLRLASVSGQGEPRRDWFLVLHNTGASGGREVTFNLEPVDVGEKPWLVLRNDGDRELATLVPEQELRFPILPNGESAREVHCIVSWTDERGRQEHTVRLKLTDS